jgi:hypothetical protein
MRKTGTIWTGIATMAVALTAIRTSDRVVVRAADMRLVQAPAPSPTQSRALSVPAATPAGAALRPFVDRFCISCHNSRMKIAGLALDALDASQPGAAADQWEKVALKLRAEAMPPPGSPRPDRATYDVVATALEAALDRAAALRPNPGRPPVHRLNRIEYTNAVRDLLSLDIDGRSLLPPDDTGYGFDNIADVLSVSPVLIERYLSAARKISRLAVGDPTIRPASQTYAVAKYERQDDRMSDDLPFASRGGIAVRHYFPLDGEYLLKVSLLRTYTDLIRGMAEPHDLQVRLDGTVIAQFTTGGDTRADGQKKSPAELNEQLRLGDSRLEARFAAKAGAHLVGVSFLKRAAAMEGLLRPTFGVTTYEYAGDTSVLPSVSSIDLRGPFNAQRPADTPSRRRIFLCHPADRQSPSRGAAGSVSDASDASLRERTCATHVTAALARRAFRRPVTNEDVASLMTYFDLGRRQGDFEAGIQLVLEKILVSPEFLFRVESDPGGVPAGQAYTISDIELASRLSFFLWSSIPDDELLDVAARGQLKTPAVLERQVRRMLADSRANALVDNFFGQWLQLRNLRLASPDPTQFPDFDDNLRDSFRREAELFLQSQLHEDQSVVSLLTADYTFVNERLARHYQIPNIYGTHFRRVTLADDARHGLLGKGAVLTVTSYPNRTSPVLRGKWLLENILGMPPPPPPPNVPALTEAPEGSKPVSMRERMEQHRNNPVCASCHRVMDPLGFALENFDAVGHWRRASDDGAAIDATGTLPDGTPFDGPTQMRDALTAHRDQFVRAVTGKLLTYALGRGVEPSDGPALRHILRAAASSDYRWSALIREVVASQPFQMRRSADLQPTATAAP